MKTPQNIAVIFCIVSGLLTLNANAQIYTWTDKDGKVHYSDKPVEDEQVSTITPVVNNNISKSVSNHSQWQKEYYNKKQNDAKKSQEQQKSNAERERNCAQAKSRLAIYDQGGRIYIMSPEGERDYQSDAQMTAKKKQLTKLVNSNCR